MDFDLGKEITRMPRKQWSSSIASRWGLFLPPTRPSLSELVVIERHLVSLAKKKRRLKVAILGSTPEYRDLCQEYGVDYRCIEYVKSNFVALRDFMRHKDTDDRVIESDWRHMKFKERFDCFLGDLATTVTPVSDHDAIFLQIKKHANKGALIFLKTILRSNTTHLSHKEIFQLYRKKYRHLNPFAAVWYEVMLAEYDFTADTMDCQISLAALRVSLQKKILTQYEFEEFEKRWTALGNFKMNIPLKSAFLKKAKKYFTLHSLESGTDWYRTHAPIVVLRA